MVVNIYGKLWTSLLFLLLSKGEELKKPPTSIVFILADDLGIGDVGIYNENRTGDTPTIDRMGKDGIVLTQFHVMSPVCSPSRAAMMTGRESSVAGYPNIADCNPRGNKGYYYDNNIDQYRQVATDAIGRLNETWPSIAHTLKSAGYTTAMLGKWHLGCLGLPHFNEYGWDVMKSFEDHGDPASDIRWPGYTNFGSGFWTDKFDINNMQTIEAARTIFSNYTSETKIYLSLNPIVPHWPLSPRRSSMEAVPGPKECNISKFWEQNFTWTKEINKNFGRSQLRHHRGSKACMERVYRASVYEFDMLVRDALNLLDEFGRSNDALIIVTSDNGPEVPTGRLCWSQRGNVMHFRGYKRSLYEGGTRVPFIMRWSKIPKSIIHQDLYGIDLLPTFVHLVDRAQWLKNQLKQLHLDQLPGRLFPFLKYPTNQNNQRKELHHMWSYRTSLFADWEYGLAGHCSGHSPAFSARARDSDLKLLLEFARRNDSTILFPLIPNRSTFRRVELYNISADPFEQLDLLHNDSTLQCWNSLAAQLAADFLYWFRFTRPKTRGLLRRPHHPCKNWTTASQKQ